MSETITIYLDDKTELRMKTLAKELDRDLRELCATAIEEAANDYYRGRENDPAK